MINKSEDNTHVTKSNHGVAASRGSAAPALIVAGIALLWAIIGYFVPPGLYTIDELALAAGFVTFAADGNFVIANGIAQFGSPDLRLQMLVQGPNGLVMQYPSGFTVVAAPFWALSGIKGVMFLNLLSAVGILWLTWKLAEAWTDRFVAPLALGLLGGASFLVDYASGVWPHALSVFLAMGVVLCVVRVHENELMGRSGRFWALAGGLVAGLALNVRVDILFVLPPLTLWLLWYGRKPLVHLGLALLGMAPGLLVSASINFYKFGTWVPASYGYSGATGGISPYGYIAPAMIISAAALGMLVLRKLSKRWQWRAVAIFLVIAVVAASVGVPDLKARLMSMAQGFYSLMVDMAAHREVSLRPGVIDTGSGTAVYWGIAKQALAQSMPWLLVLPFAALGPRPRAGTWPLFLAIIVLVSLPFIVQHWHGGASNSQRYLMVLLPFLSIAGAVALRGLATRSPLGMGRAIGLILTATAILILAMTQGGSSAQLLLAQPFATWLFLGGLMVSILACILKNQVLVRITWVPVILGIALSFVFSYGLHLPASIENRGLSYEAEAVFAEAPPKTIIHSVPVNGAYRFFANPDVLVAHASSSRQYDMNFVREALEEGWQILTKDEALLLAAASDDLEAAYEQFAEDASGRTYWVLRASP